MGPMRRVVRSLPRDLRAALGPRVLAGAGPCQEALHEARGQGLVRPTPLILPLVLLVRRFSAGAHQGRTRAVPFELGADEALESFEIATAGHLLGPQRSPGGAAPVAIQAVRAVFLPFWTFHAQVDVLYRGRVGHKQSSTLWNPISRRWDRVTHTEWYETPLHQMRVEGLPTEQDMQFYASAERARALVEPLVGDSMASARPLTDAMLQGGRELELFQIRRETAWAAIKGRLVRQQRRQAYESLRRDYGASSVQSVEVELRVLEVTGEPIFFPCYLVTYQHQGQQLVGAVSGVDGQVSAQRLYSPLKAGAASAALLWSLGLLVATHSAVWVLASGLLAAAVAYTVRYIPLIGAALQQVAHARDVAQLQLQDHMGAAEELRRGERRARHDRQRRGQEHQQRRWQQEEEQAEQQGWSDYEVGANPFGFWRFRNLGSIDEMMREWERMVREAAYQQRQGGPGTTHGGSGYRAQYEQQQQQQQQNYGGFNRRAWEESSRNRSSNPGDPKGYYRMLGLESKGRSATEQEVKSAFRKKAMETHPDKETDEKKRRDAEEKFKKVAEAYEVLRNKEKRAAYDNSR